MTFPASYITAHNNHKQLINQVKRPTPFFSCAVIQFSFIHIVYTKDSQQQQKKLYRS